jgi:hypothetical protein
MGEDLTKYSPPLIIILGRLTLLTIGVERVRRVGSADVRRRRMKVMVYLMDNREMAVLVLASPGKGLAPVMLSDITLENIEARTLPVIAAARRGRLTQERLEP